VTVSRAAVGSSVNPFSETLWSRQHDPDGIGLVVWRLADPLERVDVADVVALLLEALAHRRNRAGPIVGHLYTAMVCDMEGSGVFPEILRSVGCQ